MLFRWVDNLDNLGSNKEVQHESTQLETYLYWSFVMQSIFCDRSNHCRKKQWDHSSHFAGVLCGHWHIQRKREPISADCLADILNVYLVSLLNSPSPRCSYSDVFSCRVLPVIEEEDDETTEEFTKRTQELLANTLKLHATDYTSADKVKYQVVVCVPMFNDAWSQ